MIKLVVFDWNGTLFDDTHIIIQGVNEELSVYGSYETSLTHYQETYCVPIRDWFLSFGMSNKTYEKHSEAANTRFHEVYENLAQGADLRDGANELLDYLETKSIAKIILSNHITERITDQLVRLKIASSFNAILANHDGLSAHHQGKLNRLEEYLSQESIAPHEVVIVGDTTEEIQIGKKLGIKSIAITGGACSIERLRTKNPNLLIPSLHEIINKLEEL